MGFHVPRLSFFSEKRMESRQRKKTPPRHCGLKNWLVTTLRATRSRCSLKQALRLTPPANFSPFGHRPPFKGAGSCTSTCLCRTSLRTHIPYECVLSHGGADPHTLKNFLHRRGGNFASRASALPYDCVTSHGGADPHTLKNVLRRRGGKFCAAALRLPCGGVPSHEGAGLRPSGFSAAAGRGGGRGWERDDGRKHGGR